MLDASRSDLVVGVAGTGTMGRGIAQVMAQCGARTLLFDAHPGAAQKAKDAIGQAPARLTEEGRLTASGLLFTAAAQILTLRKIEDLPQGEEQG